MLLALSATPSRFDPFRFFAGTTEGIGRLHVAMRRSTDVHVQGHGRMAADTLILDQAVERAGTAPTTRRWLLRRDGPGRYTGTLSDAIGPVMATSVGATLRISYRAAHGIRIRQWLTLGPDGRTAQNRLVATKFGIVVARLNETIHQIR